MINVFKLATTTSTKGLQSYPLELISHLSGRGVAPVNQ